MTFVETIQAAVERHGLIPAGTRVVAGVSGGADSVALLRAFHRLGIACTAAHLNHHLRGAASDADEDFVRALAGELDVPVVIRHADVHALAGSSGLSIEMAARQARHAFFASFDDAVIALAHHADDQVETFILKLARGAGPEGLSGMSFYQEVGPLRLIRPMLEIPRTAIIAWLNENGFGWREDATNHDETFPRNRVRNTILPLLEQELNPRFRETVLRTIELVRGENEWLAGLVTSGAMTDIGAPLAARRRAVRSWLFGQGAEEAGFDAVEKILSLIDAGNGTRVYELNSPYRVVVEYGRPRLESTPCNSHASDWMLTVEKGTGWRRDHGRGVGILPAEASFDAGRVDDAPIEVRTWRPGDRISPHGMNGSRKLQDILTDQKIPAARRAQIPVVTCRDEIIWLPGYRTARGWEVPGEDDPAVHVRIHQTPAQEAEATD